MLNKDKRTKPKHSVAVYTAVTVTALLAVAGLTAWLVNHFREQSGTDGQKNLRLHLTDESITPSCGPLRYEGSHWINGIINGGHTNSMTNYGLWAESEQGWYYFKESTVTPEEEETQRTFGSSKFTLCFKDKETGQEVPLCANPSCKHDTNIFCTATTRAYLPCDPVYYDGALYAVTTKYTDPDGEDPDPHQVLLRYAADGTSIEELYNFGEGTGSYAPIIHRGYIWCIVQKQSTGEITENPVTHSEQLFVSGGWELWGYELATGKTVMLHDAIYKDTVSHTNDPPVNFYAAGDALYFATSEGDWFTPQGICRISLLNGQLDVIAPYNPGSTVAISPDKLLYTKRYTRAGEPHAETHIYDLSTGTDTVWDNENTASATDGTYCYELAGGTKIDSDRRYWALTVCDMDGNEVCKRDLPYASNRNIGEGGCTINPVFIDSGKICLRVTEYIPYRKTDKEDSSELQWMIWRWKMNQMTREYYIMTDIQSILDGNAEWTELYCCRDDQETIDKVLEGGAADHAE